MKKFLIFSVSLLISLLYLGCKVGTEDSTTESGSQSTETEKPAPKICKLKFDPGNETKIADIELKEGSVIKQSDIDDRFPLKKGYSFEGWYNGNEKLEAGFKVTENVEFKAKWKLNEYTISFDSNSGSGKIKSVIATVEDTSLKLPKNTFTPPSGYKRIYGWNLNGVHYDDDEEVISVLQQKATDLIFQAEYMENDFAIKITVSERDYIFGINNGETFAQKTTDAIRALEPNILTEGYKSVDWYVDGSKITLENYRGSADKVLTPKKIPIEYSVVFDMNNYEGDSSSLAKIDCVYDEEFTLPKNPAVKRFYKDAGWGTEPLGGVKIYTSLKNVKNLSSVDGDEVTLYAQMKEDFEAPVYVNLSTDAGTLSISKITKKYKQTFNYSELPRDSLKGHDFDGWYLLNDEEETKLSSTSEITLTDNIEIKAKWKAHTATVNLYTNNSTISSAQIYDSDGNIVYYYEKMNLTYGKKTKVKNYFWSNNYYFTGWNTKADGMGTSYADNYDFASMMESETSQYIYLYAQWAKKEASMQITMPSNPSSNDLTLTYSEDTRLLTATYNSSTVYCSWYVDGVLKDSSYQTFNVPTYIGKLSDGLHTVMAVYTTSGATYSATALITLNMNAGD